MNQINIQEIEKYDQILNDLIAIPSVKGTPTEGAPYGQAPKAALDYYLNMAKADGFITRNVGDKAGYVQWGDKGPLVAALGHLDVVPAGSAWNSEPFSLTCKDGYFTGRGVVDDKGPMVSAYMALLRLKEKYPDPPFRLRLIVGTDEENGSTCMERYCETEELPDIGFTPDAEFPCIFAEKGIYQMHFEGNPCSGFSLLGGNAANMVPPYCEYTCLTDESKITQEGLQAHASHPEMGINAIDQILSKLPKDIVDTNPLLKLMKKYFSASAEIPFADLFTPDLSGKATTNVGMVHIGPDEARLHVDIRFPVTLSSDVVTEKLEAIASEFGVKVVQDSVLEPLFKDKESNQIKTLVSIYEKYRDSFEYDPEESDARKQSLSTPAEPLAIGGGTYARTMPNIVAFGPQLPWEKDQCHQSNESILKKNLYLLVPLYEEALEKLGKIVI